MSSSPSIEQLRAANDAEGLIALIKDDLGRTREAANALVDLPEPTAAAQPMMALLAERDAFIARRAQQIRDNPNAPIRSSESAARDGANADMVHIEFVAIRFFAAVGSKEGLELIARSTDDSDVRRNAESAVERWAPPLDADQAVEERIKQLGFPFWSSRLKAAQALGKLRDARAVEPLIACLADDDFGVVRAAADALAVIGDARAVEPLVALIGQYKGGAGWRNVVDALGVLGGQRAEETLESLAREGDARLSQWAAVALARLRGQS